MPEANGPTHSSSVSIIIPVFNGMATLAKCLDSIEKQDYPNITETIVVDDGSTDSSGDYAESRGCKVLRQSNQGPGAARNRGAVAASGELLVFVDADCFPDPAFTSELVRPLIGTEIAGSQGVFYSNQKNLVARFIQHEISERYRKQGAAEFIDWVATYGACYRRRIFQENDGFDDAYSSEDVELSIRLAQKGHKMVLAKNAYCEHLNYENVFKYIRYKYKRAYWTVWLYKKHPSRMLNDTMTPFSRKFMMMLLVLSLLFLAVGMWWKLFLCVGLFSAAAFFVLTLPLSLIIMSKDPQLGLSTPFFLLMRTMAYVCGFGLGVFDYRRGVRRARSSATK
jgi:glycosyltransferase involved in cell wall biosynthesis